MSGAAMVVYISIADAKRPSRHAASLPQASSPCPSAIRDLNCFIPTTKIKNNVMATNNTVETITASRRLHPARRVPFSSDSHLERKEKRKEEKRAQRQSIHTYVANLFFVNLTSRKPFFGEDETRRPRPPERCCSVSARSPARPRSSTRRQSLVLT